MTTHTITASTSYSAISPAPEAGDDIVLSGANIVLTIDIPTVVLAGISGSDGLSGHHLIINSELHISGDVSAYDSWSDTNHGTITLGPDSLVEYHGSSATKFHSNATDGAEGGLITSTATVSHPATIKGAGYLSIGGNCEAFDLSHVRFENVTTTKGRYGLEFNTCGWDADCGLLTFYYPAATADINVVNCWHYGIGENVYFNNVATPAVAQLRSVNGFVISGTLRVEETASMVFTNMYFAQMNNYSATPQGQFVNCFCDTLNVTAWTPSKISGGFISNSTDIGNAHFIGGCLDVEGAIFEAEHASMPMDRGDAVMCPMTGGTTVQKVKKCIVINTDVVGLTCFGHDNLTCEFDQNTIMSDVGINIGETYEDPLAGFLASCKNNILAGGGAGGRLINKYSGASVPADGCFVDVDYNCCPDATDPYSLDSWEDEYASAPGTHDNNIDPKFIGAGCGLRDWAISKGCTSEDAGVQWDFALATLEAAFDVDNAYHQIGCTVADLCATVKHWYAPTNMGLAVGGAGGALEGYFGAVEPVALSGAATMMSASYHSHHWVNI